MAEDEMPEEPPDVPGDPGVWESLANERTQLAWSRTSLSLAAMGSVFLKSFPPFERRGAHPAIGIFVMASGAALWAIGYVRYRIARERIRESRSVVVPGLLRATSLLVGAVGVAAFFFASFER